MTNPLHAAYYADRAVQRRVTVAENVRMARDTYRLRFDCPDIARRITPGQFVMLRLAGWDDPLLGRPMALFDTVLSPDGEPAGLDLVYLVLGKMTARLARLAAGQELEVWGPLGNGFAPVEAEHLVMVAGGIGQTPFPALAAEALARKTYGRPPRPAGGAKRVTLCYGVRSADLLAGRDEFERLGVEVRTSTDDGTAGYHGLVTDLLAELLARDSHGVHVACCGPVPMMEAVAGMTASAGVPCEVSLETPMACGIGICFSCVAKVRDDSADGWDYKRTCVDGPVFRAQEIEW